jgi:Cu+-exporting ATPase
VIENKEILGLIGINDIIRDTSKELISNLKECKIEPIMLTGDNIKTAEKIAKEIGITNIIANVLPTEKADKIKNLQKENRKIMMVGDGINDSPALAISDIGVSITSGTDIAMDSSDVILMQNDLSKILSLIKISKKTIRNIKQNLFWAFFYNVLMIPIAMGVLKPIGISINPMIAGLAMTLSSLTVILNASRLKYIKF